MAKILQKDNPLNGNYSTSNIVKNNIVDIPLMIDPQNIEIKKDISNYKDRSFYDINCIIFWAPITDRVIPGIEQNRYFVNTIGQIYDTYRQGYLNPILHNKGYLQCHFYTPYNLDQRSTTRKIHRVVMMAFYYFPDCYKYEVNHIDGNKTNNNITNLEWATHSENTIHAINNGLKTIFGRSDLKVNLTDDDIDKILYLNSEGYTNLEIIDIFKNEGKIVGKVQISNLICGKNRLSYFNDLYNVRS